MAQLFEVIVDPGKITKLVPLVDRVLIRLDVEKERVSDGGIVMPNKEDEVYTTPVVAATGHDVDMRKYDFKVGDKVIYNEYDAKRIQAKNKLFVLVKPENIWAKISAED